MPESLNRIRTPEDSEIPREIEKYKRFKKWEDILKERAKQMARASVLALSLQTVTIQTLQDETGKSGEHASTTETRSDFSGKYNIELADGSLVLIPNLEGMKVETLLLPDDQIPDRIVMLFPQTHRIDPRQFNEVDDRGKLLREMIKSQKQIYKALHDLASRSDIGKVCAEGLVQEDDMDDMIRMFQESLLPQIATYLTPYLPDTEIAKAHYSYRRIFADLHLSPDEYAEWRDDIRPTMQRYVADYKYIVGAPPLLAAEGEVQLCPAETRATRKRAGEIISSLGARPAYKWTRKEKEQFMDVVLEDREDAALSQIAKQGQKKTAFVFGAGHSWADALDRWNVAHPDVTFAIVIIVPDEE